ncbi:hypothetical protein NDU88_004542 [Pleurodeles waltl]|uniref:Uncharacterized protein n=1 Tax=Pleurodeles waltl TaxID=8319 RepID=A0AAV7LID5_PLEWA|nr:hypothetical protein NDU88_004542 [Pleurodeles waltl]
MRDGCHCTSALPLAQLRAGGNVDVTFPLAQRKSKNTEPAIPPALAVFWLPQPRRSARQTAEVVMTPYVAFRSVLPCLPSSVQTR